MKSGPEKLRIFPHVSAAVNSAGWTVDEKRLKETSSRNGCMGTCKTESAREPQKRRREPCMRACSDRRSERVRKAFLDSVASVKGKKIRICNTVESLHVAV